MDLSKYSIKRLQTLRNDVDKEIASRRGEEKKKAREELKEVATKYGFSLNDLVNGSATNTRGRSRAPAKFHHPENPSKTWSGRGRKPQWVKEWEDAGRSLDELRAA